MTDPYRFYGDMIAMNNEMTMQGLRSMEGGLQNITDAYVDRKTTQAKADSYAKIGEILGGGMFADDPQAKIALDELKKEKDPYKRSIGYETLFGLFGAYSNTLMARRNAGIRENQQALTAVMPNLRAQQNAAAQVAAGQGRVTTLPSNINPDAIP